MEQQLANLVWALVARALGLCAKKHALAISRGFLRLAFGLVTMGLPSEAKDRWRAEGIVDIEEDVWDFIKDASKSQADAAAHVLRRAVDLLWNGWSQRHEYLGMEGQACDHPPEAAKRSGGWHRRLAHVVTRNMETLDAGVVVVSVTGTALAVRDALAASTSADVAKLTGAAAVMAAAGALSVARLWVRRERRDRTAR